MWTHHAKIVCNARKRKNIANNNRYEAYITAEAANINCENTYVFFTNSVRSLVI